MNKSDYFCMSVYIEQNFPQKDSDFNDLTPQATYCTKTACSLSCNVHDGNNNRLVYLNANTLSKVKRPREEERIEERGHAMNDNSILPVASSRVSHAM